MLMIPEKCPCCGGPLQPGQIVVDLRTNTVAAPSGAIRLSPQMAIIVHVLSKTAKPVSRDRLISALHGVSETKNPEVTLRVQIMEARKRLRPIGLSIENTRDIGYFLNWDKML